MLLLFLVVVVVVVIAVVVVVDVVVVAIAAVIPFILLHLLPPLCLVFTIMYLKRTMFLWYTCCSCSVFTICATCNAISHVQYVLYFYISTFQNACAVPNTVVVCR